jgi:hypothetical protein
MARRRLVLCISDSLNTASDCSAKSVAGFLSGPHVPELPASRRNTVRAKNVSLPVAPPQDERRAALFTRAVHPVTLMARPIGTYS